MTDAERQSLKAVLEYLSDERKHYEACIEAGESVDGHIYTRVQVLEGYLERHTPAEAAAGLSGK
jgi:hypothetical protein